MSGISTAEVQHSPPCILQLDTFSSDDCQLNTAFRNPDWKLAARCRPACARLPDRQSLLITPYEEAAEGWAKPCVSRLDALLVYIADCRSTQRR